MYVCVFCGMVRVSSAAMMIDNNVCLLYGATFEPKTVNLPHFLPAQGCDDHHHHRRSQNSPHPSTNISPSSIGYLPHIEERG